MKANLMMFFKYSAFWSLIQFGFNECLEDVLYEVELDQDPSKELYYFAYGSNMLKKRMKRNVEQVQYRGVAVLRDFRLDFDSYLARWKGAVATVTEDPGGEVWGVLWGMSKADAGNFTSRQENSSKLYQHRYVKVYSPELKEHTAFTHIAKKPPRKLPPWMALPEERRPSAVYLQMLISAATENNFPEKYLNFLIGFLDKGNQTLTRRSGQAKRDKSVEGLEFHVKFKL